MQYSKLAQIGIVALLVAMFVSPVMAGGYKDYAADDLAKVQAAQANDYLLTGYLACHNNLFDQHLDVERAVVDGYVDAGEIAIDAAGYYEAHVAPGMYRITLADGNGGQPEVHYVMADGYPAGLINTDQPFLGHAATLGDGAAAPDVIEIVEATYGKIVLVSAAIPGVAEVSHIVHHAAIPAVPAYDEYVYVGHNHGDYALVMGHYMSVGHNHGDYDKVHHNAIPAVPAYDETVIDVPAQPAVPAVYAGAIVDVKAEVQAAADAGHRALKFDNNQHPGGLFDANTNALLAQIADPAVGIVKAVHIEYKLNGVSKTIDKMEYETINL